jgi:hypothetical protein
MPNIVRVLLLILALVAVHPFIGSALADDCETGPFGAVTVTQVGANVNVVVTLSSAFQFAKTGATDFQLFKFNISGGALGDIIVNQTVPGKTLAAQTGNFDRGQNGDFAFGITCTNCRNGRAGALPVGSVISFTVVNATIADVTAPNDAGVIFAAGLLCVSTGTTEDVDLTVPYLSTEQ